MLECKRDEIESQEKSEKCTVQGEIEEGARGSELLVLVVAAVQGGEYERYGTFGRDLLLHDSCSARMSTLID